MPGSSTRRPLPLMRPYLKRSTWSVKLAISVSKKIRADICPGSITYGAMSEIMVTPNGFLPERPSARDRHVFLSVVQRGCRPRSPVTSYS